jgi:Na+/proline symporter
VGSVNYPVIIVVGILTMAYTAYGGLFISIITDQVQAMLIIVFIAILSVSNLLFSS